MSFSTLQTFYQALHTCSVEYTALFPSEHLATQTQLPSLRYPGKSIQTESLKVKTSCHSALTNLQLQKTTIPHFYLKDVTIRKSLFSEPAHYSILTSSVLECILKNQKNDTTDNTMKKCLEKEQTISLVKK